MATEDDKIDTGALATVVAVGAVAMVGISLAVNALVRHEVGTIGADRDEVGANAYRALKKEQLDKLSTPAVWADQGKGHVAIPIERAMNLTLADLKRSPWNATPAPPPDAGTDAAAMETPDAGTDAAVETPDAATTAEADAGPAPALAESGTGVPPEPPGSKPLSPGGAPAGSAPPAPKPSAPRTLPPPTIPAAPPPPASAPAQPAPPAPPATKP